MPRVVADVDSDLKQWLQHYAIDHHTTMGAVIASLLEEFRQQQEAKQTGKKSSS